MTDYQFEWDPAKDKANQRKHGIPFQIAAQVFDDPLHLSEMDRIESGEYRWQTIGRVNDTTLLLVAHTYLDDDQNTVVRGVLKKSRRLENSV